MAQTGEGCAGLVTAQLTLATTAARPGDAVTALLQVSCAQPEVLELQVLVGTSHRTGLPWWLQRSFRRMHVGEQASCTAAAAIGVPSARRSRLRLLPAPCRRWRSSFLGLSGWTRHG